MRVPLATGIAVLLGVFLLVSLGLVAFFALPVSVVAFAVLMNRRKMSRGAELLALGTMEVALAWFVWPGLYYRTGVSPDNYLLADGIAVLFFALPPTVFLIARSRYDRASLSGLALFLLLIGIVAVPFIPLGGACTGPVGGCHNVYTYGSASWLFVCAGAEFATFPGDVSTGLPTFPLSLNTPFGNYFFADCAFM
ncbi:MAG: hypothetical protein OK452_02070 [Thaumarchaeota archaeon]|nr:hypothetical protein [Nitrososphaerota archaeon]